MPLWEENWLKWIGIYIIASFLFAGNGYMIERSILLASIWLVAQHSSLTQANRLGTLRTMSAGILFELLSVVLSLTINLWMPSLLYSGYILAWLLLAIGIILVRSAERLQRVALPLYGTEGLVISAIIVMYIQLVSYNEAIMLSGLVIHAGLLLFILARNCHIVVHTTNKVQEDGRYMYRTYQLELRKQRGFSSIKDVISLPSVLIGLILVSLESVTVVSQLLI